jgi:hypothetical protein
LSNFLLINSKIGWKTVSIDFCIHA